MNDRNTDLFFNEDNEEVALITLNDEDGNEVDAALMAVFQIEEVYSDEEFAVLMPLEQDEEALANGEGEVLIFRYFEDEAGNPNFEAIEDDEMAQTAIDVFQAMVDNGDIKIQFNTEEEVDEDEAEEAAEGANSIDLGDVVVHLDDYDK